MGFSVAFLPTLSAPPPPLFRSSFPSPACSPPSLRRQLPGAIRSQQSDSRPPYHHAATTSPSDAPRSSASSYTSMHSHPEYYWDTHQGLPHHDPPPTPPSCTATDEVFISAQLRLLLSSVSDRAEMHAILAQQRDNWNILFQRMLTSACFMACLLSGLDSRGHCLGLTVPALLLNAGSAAMMAIINQFQPSQLAEEQRTVYRLFRKLASDITYALQVDPSLRQHAPSLLRDCRRRLQALDEGFPMPLTPGGLDKFPAKVVPPTLSEEIPLCASTSGNATDQHHTSDTEINGWNGGIVSELQEVANVLRRSDIPKYTNWAQNIVKVNKCLAVASPLLAGSAALLNFLAIAVSTSVAAALPSKLSMWAAICSVLAAFVGSFSHDMQLGMVFELYRNSAGYYANIEKGIRETLEAPVQERENGELFRQRIANALGRSVEASSCKMVPKDAQEAGVLF